MTAVGAGDPVASWRGATLDQAVAAVVGHPQVPRESKAKPSGSSRLPDVSEDMTAVGAGDPGGQLAGANSTKLLAPVTSS